MNDHEKILQLIETVDPSDTAALDEIDARVWCYITETLFHDFDGEKFVTMTGTLREEWTWREWNDDGAWEDNRRYTRSRDALKAIRPERWHFDMIGWVSDYRYIARKSAVELECPRFISTEELAELHAIIQAIAFERGQEEQ